MTEKGPEIMGDKEKGVDYSEAYIVVKSTCEKCPKAKNCNLTSEVQKMYTQLKENVICGVVSPSTPPPKVEIVYEGAQDFPMINLTDGLFPDKLVPAEYYFLYKLLDGRRMIMIPALKKNLQKPKTSCDVNMYA